MPAPTPPTPLTIRVTAMCNPNQKTAAIIAAGGTGSRITGADKLFADLGGTPCLIRAILPFEDAASITEIVVAARPETAERIAELCKNHGISKLKAIVNGGQTRMQSVLNALAQVSADINFIAVHDGARPFITAPEIDSLVKSGRELGAVIPAVAVKETVKVTKNNKIINTHDRSGLYLAQTPQIFPLAQYRKAAEIALNSGKTFTDDAAMLETAGFEVSVTQGNYNNIKITTPDDLQAAQTYFDKIPHDCRIGTGYDVHRLVEGRELILCGVKIPHDKGLLGHSDADVALHALMDALLGAAALGDIGAHFPDSDPAYKGISSLKLLRQTMKLLDKAGYKPSNIDITIIAEAPKLAPYITQMRSNTAKACEIPIEFVSVKATTEEGLNLSGKGIAANAVCMVKRQSSPNIHETFT